MVKLVRQLHIANTELPKPLVKSQIARPAQLLPLREHLTEQLLVDLRPGGFKLGAFQLRTPSHGMGNSIRDGCIPRRLAVDQGVIEIKKNRFERHGSVHYSAAGW